jgi:hypothetical protein
MVLSDNTKSSTPVEMPIPEDLPVRGSATQVESHPQPEPTLAASDAHNNAETQDELPTGERMMLSPPANALALEPAPPQAASAVMPELTPGTVTTVMHRRQSAMQASARAPSLPPSTELDRPGHSASVIDPEMQERIADLREQLEALRQCNEEVQVRNAAARRAADAFTVQANRCMNIIDELTTTHGAAAASVALAQLGSLTLRGMIPGPSQGEGRLAIQNDVGALTGASLTSRRLLTDHPNSPEGEDMYPAHPGIDEALSRLSVGGEAQSTIRNPGASTADRQEQLLNGVLPSVLGNNADPSAPPSTTVSAERMVLENQGHLEPALRPDLPYTSSSTQHSTHRPPKEEEADHTLLPLRTFSHPEELRIQREIELQEEASRAAAQRLSELEQERLRVQTEKEKNQRREEERARRRAERQAAEQKRRRLQQEQEERQQQEEYLKRQQEQQLQRERVLADKQRWQREEAARLQAQAAEKQKERMTQQNPRSTPQPPTQAVAPSGTTPSTGLSGARNMPSQVLGSVATRTLLPVQSAREDLFHERQDITTDMSSSDAYETHRGAGTSFTPDRLTNGNKRSFDAERTADSTVDYPNRSAKKPRVESLRTSPPTNEDHWLESKQPSRSRWQPVDTLPASTSPEAYPSSTSAIDTSAAYHTPGDVMAGSPPQPSAGLPPGGSSRGSSPSNMSDRSEGSARGSDVGVSRDTDERSLSRGPRAAIRSPSPQYEASRSRDKDEVNERATNKRSLSPQRGRRFSPRREDRGYPERAVVYDRHANTSTSDRRLQSDRPPYDHSPVRRAPSPHSRYNHFQGSRHRPASPETSTRPSWRPLDRPDRRGPAYNDSRPVQTFPHRPASANWGQHSERSDGPPRPDYGSAQWPHRTSRQYRPRYPGENNAVDNGEDYRRTSSGYERTSYSSRNPEPPLRRYDALGRSLPSPDLPPQGLDRERR